MGKKSFYAVRVGRQPGIYSTWAEAEPLVKGYPGAKYKGFGTMAEAEQFMAVGPSASLPLAVDNFRGVSHGTAVAVGPYATIGVAIVSHAAPANARKRTRDDDELPASRPAPPNHEDGPPRPYASGTGRCTPKVEGPLSPINPNRVYQLEFDGASKGNPGLAGAGAVLRDRDSSQVVCRLRNFLGSTTNNVAEYTGLIEGLKMAHRVGVKRLDVLGDSKLVVEQVMGRWRVNKPHLQPLLHAAQDEMGHFDEISIKHVLREWNADADRMSNEAVDMAYA